MAKTMKDDRTPIEKFWDAVIAQDYETVRQAIAEGFDVNARIPGKVEPITFAQPAEDMVMLKILWEAGAHPATPWLEAVFADFASGGDGSKTKNLVGKRLSLPTSYDERTGDYAATIYYVEHVALEANEIEFVAKKKSRYLIRWTGQTTDVNYYDGSKPDTRVEIEGWFTFSL